MRNLSRVLRGRKSWSQPPFWTQPDLLTSVTSLTGDREAIAENFEGYVRNAYKANGVVFTCVLVRVQLFSQIRFRYQHMVDGEPGDLFGHVPLLENPWPNATTGELLARMEQDVSLGGNFYGTVNQAGAIRRLRPDWVTILTGSPSDDPFDIDAEPIAYIYDPRRGPRRSEPTVLLPDQVVHYSPIPDPEAQWRGMSWVTPFVREVQADTAATKHKLKFFENGTTSNFVVSYESGLTKDQFLECVAAYKEAHTGVDNAYKTIHLGGGAEVTTVGADMKQLDFKATQGAGESRVAAGSGVGAIVAQFSEGMQGSSLNAGNYGAARRRASDVTLQHLWRTATASLAKLASVPAGARLWFDASDMPFLREDAKDAAAIEQIKQQIITGYVKEGFTAASATAAVAAGDVTLLEHTGLVSVQLQPPMPDGPPPSEPKRSRVVRDEHGRVVGVEEQA